MEGLTLSHDAREARLPLWAQELIRSLRRERDEAETAADDARLATKPDESSAVLHPYSDIPIGLGRDARVRFKTGRNSWLDVQVRGDAIEVMGARCLELHAQSGNVFQLKCEEW
jgi:hypothetical protein